MARANSSLGVVGLLLLGLAACSSSSHNFGTPGAGGGGGDTNTAGTSGAEQAGASGAGSGNTSPGEGGNSSGAGLGGQAGGDGTAGNAGSAGSGGSVATAVAILQPTLATGKTYVAYTSTITASGGASYTWSLTSGALPAGLALQSTTSASVKIAGTPTEAGQFPITLGVTDGSSNSSIDLTLTITQSVLFLSDRNATGVNELFLTEVGAPTVAAPVRLSASFPSGGGISSYTWSPDGSKVLYLASQSTGGTAELWVSAVATPGTAQRVSAAGVTVSLAVWLRAGDIAAYSSSVGDTYLADLSSSVPGASKLVIPGPTPPNSLRPSPNGTSLIVANSTNTGITTLNYATWGAVAPTSVTLDPGSPTNLPLFSYDGRFAAANSSGGGRWWDLSLTAPALATFGGVPGFSFSWSPNAEAILYTHVTTAVPNLSFGTFTAGTLTSTVLVPDGACSSGLGAAPWSPDGKNTLFACGFDIRGIRNVATAAVSTDFSLLPTSFLSNAFTDIPTVGWSPDSNWIALRADRDVNAQYDLFLLRWSTPGTAYKPYTASVTPGIAAFAFAQNSQAVAFVGTVSPQTSAGLYLTALPASGAPPSATLVSGNAVVQNDVKWLPGSRVMVYRGTVAGATQLFSIPVAADGTAGSVTPVSGVSGSGVSSYQVDPAR